jgi:ribosomal protein S21
LIERGVTIVAEVKRKKGESFESLLRRFSRKVQESGKLLQVRKIRYHSKVKSKAATRDAALRREYLRGQREYLIKTGQKTEEDFRPARKSGRR